MNPKTSMQDIADLLGISKNAVSLALNHKSGVSEELRTRIFEAADRLHYRTEPKHKKKQGSFLIFLPENERNDQIYDYEIFCAMEIRAKGLGYQAILCRVSNDMQDQLALPEIYREMVFHGLLIIGVLPINYIRKLIELKLPIVTVDHYYEPVQLDAVVAANAEDAYKLVAYLIEKGHKQIGFVGSITLTKKGKERWFGYQQAMMDASLVVDMEKCMITDSSAEIDTQLAAMTSMPTAWFCTNDRIAISLIQLLTANGYKVPEDISIVGFDNIEAAALISPSLTTIQVNHEQLGLNAVDVLIRKIDDAAAPSKISIFGELIERDSSQSISDFN
ncbi:LacI family DNA-binding transcriptional regulator [Paenibacillus sp. N3.4]|uniref:LacI family DNA-binding transcriptional regulator n=1 Tax=Paenibacillus sp. N3.4 TaxID=2603222 RepID=UPI0011CB59AD|nr:LacI family DNA-binding transcriptional regulator [Paenibacillus sp. N3.4]TXK84513.1 LacI family transcriptional regulator [Paenibacillus sp. N3.4]